MATLSLQHIDKIYPNHVQAVYDFNLEVKDKEFIVFVGPSGCGKSTTLRMIAGFEPISNGRLYIDGVYMNNVEPKDRNIAMVFQNYALYPHMTVYENLKFALELRKLSCPIYQESAEISSLKEQEKPIRKEIKKVVSLFTKNQNSHTLLTQYTELYRRLLAIEDQIQSLYQPVVGIDHDEIKRLKKDIESLAKDIAYGCIIPQGFDRQSWRSLTQAEKFYLKGLESEKRGDTKIATYQEFARGFGIAGYGQLMASEKANAARLKTPVECGERTFGDVPDFSHSLLRTLFAAIAAGVRADHDPRTARDYLKTELGSAYWEQRDLIRRLLAVLIDTRDIGNMKKHWAASADVADMLLALVANDGV